MRLFSCFIVTTLLAGCGTAGDRALYDGFRQEEARRRYEPGRDISRDAPLPSFNDYEKERQRLQKESRP